MKNKFYIILFLFFIQPLLAENLNIKSSSVSIDKKNQTSVFKNNVIATDNRNNKFQTDFAEYNKKLSILKSKGNTKIITSEGYIVKGTDIIFDNKKKVIYSKNKASIQDLSKNDIQLENFEYFTEKSFFKSIGQTEITDAKNNKYNFSQIYIDEKKREIVGTDIKAYINEKNFKVNKDNKPRVFANTININENESTFSKSIFTMCDYRENDKCPPWSLQASQMKHDQIKKTIYYDNAVVKVYDFPIFYIPKLSHPDPSVSRRSGFLTPSISNSKNLGTGFEIPYFWAFSKDKDLTLSSKLYSSEHPLLLGEYRQAFKNSNVIFDFGYTQGYKNSSVSKKAGDKSHFFSKFVKNFKGKNNSENNFELSFQEVSNDKYLKLYKIDSSLVDYETDTLINNLNFTHTKDDLFFGFEASSYETLKDSYNDKYEYILPEITFNKNLFSNLSFGTADFQSNLKVHNYDTNKFTKFLTNDIDWKYKSFNFPSGIQGQVLGKLKNVNYEVKNVSEYKKDPTSEVFGALGYMTSVDLFKKDSNNSTHLLTPKLLFRYAPGHMRKEKNDFRLSNLNIFDLDRLNSQNNFEEGLSASLGFDYEIESKEKTIDLSIGQIINNKENKKMPSSSSLDEKLSDVVGNLSLKTDNNFEFKYNFALDQNYKDLNYNEIGVNLDFNPIKFDFNYLQEKNHIGDQEYFKGSIELAKSDNGLLSLETKRNLITNSAEYYNLSYEYLNDCLKAGLVYRREFYNDSELDAENSLMFKITLIPFGNINSPSLNK